MQHWNVYSYNCLTDERKFICSVIANSAMEAIEKAGLEFIPDRNSEIINYAKKI